MITYLTFVHHNRILLLGVPLPLTTRPVEMDPDIAKKSVENASWQQKNDRLKVVVAPLSAACIVAAPNIIVASRKICLYRLFLMLLLNSSTHMKKPNYFIFAS